MKLGSFNPPKRKILMGIIFLFLLFTLPLRVNLAQQRQTIIKKAVPIAKAQQYDVPLEWATLEVGSPPSYYDGAVEMHLNAVFICTALGNNPSSWQAAYQPLIDRGLKVIAMPGCLTYSNNMWNKTELKPFLNWLRDNPAYKNMTFAIFPIDEPYWTNGNDIDGDSCPGYHHDSLAQLYNFIHSESGGVPVHYDMGGGGPLFWYNQNKTGSYNSCYQGRTGIDGIADYQAGYVSNGADSSYNQQEVVNFINNNKVVTDETGTKLVVLIRTWTTSSFNMTEDMIYNLTCDILNTRQVSGLIYYPFAQNCCGYQDYLANHQELWDDIARAIDQCSYGYGIPPTPPATPAPTPPDCPNFNQGDANCDNKIDELDYVVWWQNYGTGVGADFNGDGVTDELDYVIWWSYYGSSW